MIDLIERLREGCPASNDVDCLKERCKAADKIEALTVANKNLILKIEEQTAEIERLNQVLIDDHNRIVELEAALINIENHQAGNPDDYVNDVERIVREALE